MRLLLLMLYALVAPGAPAHANTLTVHECAGAHGERVFSDRATCAAVRTFALAAPVAPVAPPPAVVRPTHAERSRSPRTPRAGKRVRATAERDSYLCTSGHHAWYQHSRCAAAAGGDKKAGKVGQKRVARPEACRQIARAASVLRRGHERDERAGPYDKAVGRDPCR
jgi:hypothetical protein